MRSAVAAVLAAALIYAGVSGKKTFLRIRGTGFGSLGTLLVRAVYIVSGIALGAAVLAGYLK